ncbi:hypothetical protein B0H17DRAFT_1126582 [Mycena rosella]|uniref:Major facilitator superfamily (MFS) profile domain-containing protein n=1 Tax=Mycena rosella TaxID=1033263 RepID=A0AAD7M7U3_MYCRO|nr:hypothetical protein B0H17DRAFT_1126582 [Mycena rosella]
MAANSSTSAVCTLFLGALSLGCGFAQNAITLYILRGFQGLSMGPAAFIPASRNPRPGIPSVPGPICCLRDVLRGYTWRASFFLFAGVACLCALFGLLLIDPDMPSTETDNGLVLLVFVLGKGSSASHGWKTGSLFRTEPGDNTTTSNGIDAVVPRRRKVRCHADHRVLRVYYEYYVKLPPVLATLRQSPEVPIPLIHTTWDSSNSCSVRRLLYRPGLLTVHINLHLRRRNAVRRESILAARAEPGKGRVSNTDAGIVNEQLGTAFGMAISTTIFDAVADGRGDDAPFEVYAAAQWTNIGMAMLCTLLAAIFLSGVDPVGLQDIIKRQDSLGEKEKDVLNSPQQPSRQYLNFNSQLEHASTGAVFACNNSQSGE